MRVLYDLTFICFALFYLPFFMVRLAQAESKKRLLFDRLGCLPTELLRSDGTPRIWLHAVSVGEVLAIKKFIEELFVRFPSATIFLSTVTPTGQAVAKKRLDPRIRPFYLPFDVSTITERVIKAITPDVIVLVETELWPNLISSAHSRNIPTCIINGRLSPRSFRRYYYFRIFFKSIVAKVTKVAAQNERYKMRFTKIGFSPEDVIVTGTMKYDLDEEIIRSAPDREYFDELCGFPRGSTVMIAASTHEGEEQLFLDTFVQLRADYPALRLIIVPRHIDRAKKIIGLISAAGLNWRLADQAACGEKNEEGEADVFVINTIGQLASMYKHCDIVFMGGSMIRHGGQNPLEAVMFRKAIIAGPHIFNFHDVYNELVKAGGAVIIKQSEDMVVVLRDLLQHREKLFSMGNKALEVLSSKQGATKRNCDLVAALLHNERS
ncbi:MAG: 3-deoxy-D-manno-octulosonic acid transferase [Candidatus Omnitrophica bacterium]|nr:3-deoxy-D-manno-octulosonic acid transferase [Candidatus Omnitrophota bacterium]